MSHPNYLFKCLLYNYHYIEFNTTVGKYMKYLETFVRETGTSECVPS